VTVVGTETDMTIALGASSPKLKLMDKWRRGEAGQRLQVPWAVTITEDQTVTEQRLHTFSVSLCLSVSVSLSVSLCLSFSCNSWSTRTLHHPTL